jgi:hypothetical protein
MKQACAALFAVSLVADLQAQAGAITGRVVARGSGEPMPYAIVALPSLNIERFADDSGRFYFGDLRSGSMAVRVRRLGYVPVDTIVRVGDEAISIELERVAMTLAGITVVAHPPCLTPGLPAAPADSLLVTILNQVRLNAEQYKFLVTQYPFYYMSEIVRSSRMKKTGETRYDARLMHRQDARVESKYKPGRVLAWRAGATAFQIPGLIDFADRDFLGAHCFHLRGTEVVEEEALVRVDIVAAERIKDPDVNGSIYLDPGSFQVVRTVLRLSKITRDIGFLEDFEVTTMFREVMPSIPVIWRVSSVQKIDPRTRMAIDAAWETINFMGYQFLKRKPGDDAKRSP